MPSEQVDLKFLNFTELFEEVTQNKNFIAVHRQIKKKLKIKSEEITTTTACEV